MSKDVVIYVDKRILMLMLGYTVRYAEAKFTEFGRELRERKYLLPKGKIPSTYIAEVYKANVDDINAYWQQVLDLGDEYWEKVFNEQKK